MYRGFTLGRSPANMLHLKPFNFNYTIGTGTHFLEMLAEARALRSAGQVFSATLARDQTNPAGRVIFKPRNGYSQDTALQTKDALGAGLLLQVPGTLLAALDPRARIEFPTDSAAKTDAISRRYPQRKLIRKEELANDFSSPEWNDVKYLLEAKLDLVELSLATGSVPGPGKLYEFRSDPERRVGQRLQFARMERCEVPAGGQAGSGGTLARHGFGSGPRKTV